MEVATLLMIGSSACTYRLGKMIVKVPRIDVESEITQDNAKAVTVEANVYRMLGSHDRITQCHFLSPTGDLVTLEFYPHGNLRDYAAAYGLHHLYKWAKQMIESVIFIHTKGVRHSDLRLDQWLVDSGLDARLSDFNAAGYDGNPGLGIQYTRALGNEEVSHFMPRDPCEDNTISSDLIALASSLYELEHRSSPYAGLDEEKITQRYTIKDFPPVSHLNLGQIIMAAWEARFSSATEMLDEGERLCGL